MLAVALFPIAKTPQITNNPWMNNRLLVYPSDKILIHDKNEWSTNICYNINKLGKHVRKIKKKDHTLFDSMYIKWPE